MNIRNLKESIRSAVRNPDAWNIERDILLIVLVEMWTHHKGEQLTLDDLTDAEFRIVAEWSIATRDDYSGRIAHIRDMREVFPGLGLAAAARLV